MDADLVAAMLAELKISNELKRVQIAQGELNAQQNEELKAQNEKLIQQQEEANRIAHQAFLATKVVLTYEEAEIYSGLASRTLSELIKTGRVKSFQPGGKIRYIPRIELDRYMASEVNGSKVEAPSLKIQPVLDSRRTRRKRSSTV